MIVIEPGYTYLHRKIGFIRILSNDKLGFIYNTETDFRGEILTFDDADKYINYFYKKANK